MTNKILIGITEEQIQSGGAAYLVGVLTTLESHDVEKIKALRGGVSLMFPPVKDRSLAFLMWSLGLHAKYPNFAYFLDKESLDFIYRETLKENLKKVTPPGASICNAIDFGTQYGYTEEEMLEYFNVTKKDYDSLASKDVQATDHKESPRKCLCDTTYCGKCLSVGCVDKNCTIHTKEAKRAWRRN